MSSKIWKQADFRCKLYVKQTIFQSDDDDDDTTTTTTTNKNNIHHDHCRDNEFVIITRTLGWVVSKQVKCIRYNGKYIL